MEKNLGIQIFENEQFGQVRIAMSESNEPQFCLADVCRVLDIKNVSDCKTRLSHKGVVTTDTLTNGGVQSMVFINESNLYKCIFQSRKPDAEKFQDWVCDEVLPSIRKHGAYMVTTPQDTPETIMAKAILYADKKIKEQANAIETLEERNQLQQKELYLAAPKVAYYDAAMESKDTYSTTAIAKDLGMCATKLNTRLNELCIQYQQSGTWYLYAKYQNKGLTRIVPYYFTRSDGSQGNNPRARWTEKGREFILNLRKEGKV